MERDEDSQVRLAYLFQLFIAKKATPAQKNELMSLLADQRREEEVNSLLEDHWKGLDIDRKIFTEVESSELLEEVLDSSVFERGAGVPVSKFVAYKWFAAASLLILLSIGTYMVLRQKQESNEILNGPVADIAPGKEKATLTLGNGRRISLDDAPVGILAEQGRLKISKSADGSLVYNAIGLSAFSDGQKDSEFNTITTPRGGKFKVVLPDGSRVWMNAATTLRYPTHFGVKVRQIELAGEAYLEVNTAHAVGKRKGEKIPFRVLSGDQLVEVLGTHFNINSYTDEKEARTTLLEGRIDVSNVRRKGKIKLVPGQQCSLSKTGELQLLKDADPEEAIAWKDDIFSFKNSDIQSVMRQISRWYNVEVSFDGVIPEDHLTGYISRKVPISSVVKMLEQTSDLKFRIERNGRLIVSTKQHKNTST